MHPEPVPTSTMRNVGGRGRPPYTSEIEYGFDNVLGFGTGNEHGWRDDEVHAPEFLVSGDVLGGHAAFAFGQGSVVAAPVRPRRACVRDGHEDKRDRTPG